MAILELVLRQQYYNQDIVNRWNYVSAGTPAATTLSFALVQAFGGVTIGEGTILESIQDVQVAAVKFVDIEARVLYSDSDFYTRPFAANTTGADGGVGMSPTAAFGFRTNRVLLSVRRGTKRFVGVPEAAVGGGGVIETGTQAALQGIADAMSLPLTYDDEGNTLTFTPAVCGKDDYVTPSGKTAYKYFPNEATQLTHTAQGILWEVYDTLRTQNSRQYGRGR